VWECSGAHIDSKPRSSIARGSYLRIKGIAKGELDPTASGEPTDAANEPSAALARQLGYHSTGGRDATGETDTNRDPIIRFRVEITSFVLNLNPFGNPRSSALARGDKSRWEER
jgi:hypothetical protein